MSFQAGRPGSVDSGWINLTNTLAVGAVQYRRRDGQVFVRVIATAVTASGTTYTIVAAGTIPAGLRPDNNSRGACDFSGFPGTLVALPDGSVLMAQNSGANRAAVEGLAVYPIN
jgi:hypothetical protein